MKISATFLACKKIVPAIKKLSLTDTDYIHVDVIDNKFVKGKKIPLRKLKKMYSYTSKRLDVHLMVKRPKRYIKKFATMNTEFITFHVELGKKIEKYIDYIQSYGLKAGLAISPDTDISLLEPYMDKINLILILGVQPGYGGQAFIEKTIEKIEKVKKLIAEKNPNILLSVDGGINDEVFMRLPEVDILTVGSYITSNKDYQERITKLKALNQKKRESVE
ncbi:MAG: ribulose-phosphate 3-epimerase [Firmicutes bacterium]|nr:ribulose-phosphate 3-epimerase [Bacillota bacterium]